MLKSNQSHHLYGFTDLKTLNERGPLVISRGKGIYVYDIHDKKYLDANSGLWNACAGFDHTGLIEVAQKQYSKFAGYHSLFGRLPEEVLELSDKIIEVSPFDDGRVFFCNSGSEANDTMVKMLWMLNSRKGNPQKRKIITRSVYPSLNSLKIFNNKQNLENSDYYCRRGLWLPSSLNLNYSQIKFISENIINFLNKN